MIHIIYRISDSGYNKIKPNYINNENCLKNFYSVFSEHNIYVIADNVSYTTYKMICKYIKPSNIDNVSVGTGAGTFNLALNKALTLNDDEIIYFVENDYLHKNNADKILLEGIQLPCSFVSLYDHPDKYMNSSTKYVYPPQHGNVFCSGYGEDTKVFLSKSCHWKITNSTTMTFASKVSTLKRNEATFRKWTNINHYPHDFRMFLELKNNKENLITSLPGYSTHGETEWLSPLTDWSKL